MNFFKNRVTVLLFIVTLGAGLFVGCATARAADSPQEFINDIRLKLGLPDLPLEFVENTVMVNSPDGDLPVALYLDSQGRKYFVDLETNQVVEIDARVILLSIPPGSLAMSEAQLPEKAAQLAAATTPDFELQSPTLAYQDGFKEDLYFATWRDDGKIGVVNRPFIQIGLHTSGVLFAYYNTLSLD